MSIQPEFFESVKEFLKVAPGLILLPLSGYLAWKKINNKILASFSTYHSRTSASRIENIVLSNLKDKPVPIFSIYATIDRHIAIKVEEFNPPIILKGLESLSIDTSPVSNYYIGDNEYEPNFMPPQKIELYVFSIGRPIKCKITNSHSLESFKEFSHYSTAITSTRKFNGFVYNDNVLYAIIYHFEGKLKTAFVEDGGFITNEWDFQYNMIPKEQMKNISGVIDFLKHCKYNELFTNFSVISPTKNERHQ